MTEEKIETPVVEAKPKRVRKPRARKVATVNEVTLKVEETPVAEPVAEETKPPVRRRRTTRKTAPKVEVAPVVEEPKVEPKVEETPVVEEPKVEVEKPSFDIKMACAWGVLGVGVALLAIVCAMVFLR